ncbi:MAG: DUF1015 domain-containing protein [Planctomycetota bacterium]
MARIEPFAAIRYTNAEVSHLIAPPYDILSEADKQILLAKDDHNIVAVDLPHVPPKSAGPDEVYDQAAGELTSWLDIRAIARDPTPALYVYHQTYKFGTKTLTRKKFFARLRLSPFGEGSVFAHEQTFGGPKEDRLKLTLATRCHLSPIFGLYPDPGNEVATLFDDAIARDPDQLGMLEGVQNKLWVVTDEDVIAAVKGKLADRPIFIADGHHRYSTALMYHQKEMEQLVRVPEEHPVNYVLAVLCGMEDPGAVIQPYFRSMVDVPGLTTEALKTALNDVFTWTPINKPASAEELARRLAAVGPQAFALYFATENVCAVISPTDSDLLAKYEPKRKPTWRGLAYAIFHRYILDEVVQPTFCGGNAPTLHYHKNMQESIADAMETGGVAVLMPSVTMSQLRDICLAGELMPQKSTYFFPKLATGLVINPLY